MKIILNIILVIVFFSFLSFGFKTDCKNSFEGKWKYKKYDVSDIYVERTLTKQYEYMDNGNHYYEFDVKWVNECEYELTYVGTTSSIPAAAKIGEKLRIEIIEINDSIMKYKTMFRDLNESGEMQRIERSTS